MAYRRDVIFDVGLHRGEDSAYYLALGYSVVGFEANPRLAEFCRNRFADQIASGRFTVVEGAIASGSAETVRFYRHPNSALGTTRSDWADRNLQIGDSERIDVPRVDFGECLCNYGVPYFLKVDIEGADRVCFDALADCAERPRYVSLESEKVDFRALVAEIDMLCGLGYNRFAVVQQAGRSRLDNATCLDGTRLSHTFELDGSGPFGPDVGPWLDRESALLRYQRVFRAYRVLGDRSWLRRSRRRRAALVRIGAFLSIPVPGWYDTHATRAGP